MEQQNKLKEGAYIALGIFALMLFGAIYYYKQRMFFADASHIAFLTINEQKLQIQQYRFGSFITQMVPIICSKLGLSIRSILIAYSASFNLFYFFVALVMLWLRSYRLLVLYAFYWLLVTTHAFFWPNNEIHQGIAYMFLLFSLLIVCGEKKYKFAIPASLLVILGATALFCHPLVLPPFIFLWVYLIIEREHWHYNRKQTIVLSMVALLIVAAKLYVSKKYAGYDSNLLSGVSNMHPGDILTAFNNPFAKEIYRHVPLNYWILPTISMIGIVTLLLKKRFLLAIWTLGCALVYFIIVCLTFGGYLEFISESELMAGIIIATAPFVFVTLTSISREATIILLLFISLSRISKFHESGGHFSERVNALTELLAKVKEHGLTKVVLVKSSDYAEWKWMAEWGTATESILLSASVWDNPVCQFVIMPPADLEKRLPKNNTGVITCFEEWPVEKLNRKYFPFDTTRPYSVLSYEEFTK